MPLFKELQRRNVFRVAAAYVVSAWLLIEVGNTLEETLNLPDWADTLLAFFLILGFPLALFFSWAYEITPEGVKREKDLQADQAYHAAAASKLNKAIVGLMAVALVYFAADKFIFSQTVEPSRPALLEAAAEVESAPTPQVADEVVAVETVTVPLKSIAVLPFVNMSSDPEQEYFSDGLTEELLNLLAGIDELKVAARTSSFFYKDKLDEIPMKEVARQLEVAHILEGSVRKGGDKIRITAQLIKADDGFHLWSETYDRQMDDVFAIQDEIAAAVVNELKITLLGEAPHAAVLTPESFELSLQGRFLFNRRNEGDMERALELFERAAEIDPNNAVAWVGMTPLYLWLFDPPRLDDAERAIDKALVLEPANPEALFRKANVMGWRGEETAAWALWDKAFELDPNNPLVLSSRAGYLMQRGQVEEGLDYLRRAISADPLYVVNIGNMAAYLVTLGRWQEAEPYALKTYELTSGGQMGASALGWVRLYQGRTEEALSLAEQLPDVDTMYSYSGDSKLFILAVFQHSTDNEVAAKRALEQYRQSDWMQPIGMAKIHAWRGENDLAFEWLDRAFDTEDGPPALQELLDYLLVGLYDDPRWQAVKDRYPDFQGWDAVRR